MTSGQLDSAYLKTLTLLYVEDDATTREAFRVFLERRAAGVVIAKDGVEGLEAFRAHRAQIVITDIRMPNMDGLTMAREIRNLDPAVHIIVTTAFEDADYLSRSIETGIDQYVVKPIQQSRLEFAILTCAHRQRLILSERRTVTPFSAEERSLLATLTPREREVLACLGRGQPTREIAQGLGLSVKTVQTHQANLMLKLSLHKATALAALAVRAGIA
jgi:DNA-binding NarL/FixJ family response regulator